MQPFAVIANLFLFVHVHVYVYVWSILFIVVTTPIILQMNILVGYIKCSLYALNKVIQKCYWIVWKNKTAILN